MKKILSVILTFLILSSTLTYLPLVASADDPTSGTCGDNVTWSFDAATGTLSIDGTGPIDRYYYGGPWNDSFKNDIRTVVIGSGVTSLGGGYTLYDLTNLKELYISDTVVELGCWWNCYHLEEIYVDENNPVYDSRNNCNAVIETATNTLICGCSSNTTIPAGVEAIAYGAYSYCGINSIVIDSSVTSIGNGVFMYSSLESVRLPLSLTSVPMGLCAHTGLTSVNIPPHVTTIGEGAFSYCYSLEDVYIPDGCTTIGKDAFAHSGLTSVYIPLSVTNIEYEAFYDNYFMHDIYYEGTQEQWEEIEKGYYCFTNTYSTVHYNCERPVLSGQCGDNITWTLNKDTGVLKLSGYGSCYAYRNYTHPEWYDYKDYITSIEMEDGITDISYYLFAYHNNLEEISIPDSVTYIDEGAFYECTSLKSIDLPDNITRLKTATFYYCIDLESVDLPANLEEIGMYAFYNDSSLTSVVIPDSVRDIDLYAFSYCDNLTSVTLGSGIQSITASFSDTPVSTVYYNGTEAQWLAVYPSCYIPYDEIIYLVSDECTVTLDDTLRYSNYQVTMRIDNNPGIWGYEGELTFNEDALRCDDVIIGDVFASSELIYNTAKAGRVRFVFTADDEANVCTDGLLVTFVFTVLDREQPFDVEYIFRENRDMTALDVENLWPVSVNPVIDNEIDYENDIIYGDASGDGIISVKDVLTMRLTLAGSTELSENAALACDLNGDGMFSTADILLLRLHMTCLRPIE